MSNLLAILVTLAMVGCGYDPDDAKPMASDGCRSDDVQCQEDKVAKEASTEEEETEEAKEKNQESIVVESEVTVKTKVVIGNNGEEISHASADDCMAGKICRGALRWEVLQLLGDPDTFERTGSLDIWEWKDFSGDSVVCSGFTCTISFKDDLVVDQERIDAEWLDLENF